MAATAGIKDGDDVCKLFIFDTRLGQREDNEHEKIMFYYPASATIDEQLGDVGLCEGLINFTRTFSPNKPCRAVHTDLVRQVLWEPEPSIWLVLVVKRARPPKRDSDSYGDDDLSSQVLDAVLRNAYQMLRLFHGTMHRIANEKGADGLRRTLALVMPSYISTLPPISKLDLAFCLGGVRYFPVDRNTFLSLQSFFHLAQQDFPSVRFGICLYQDLLVWSSLPNAIDINALYTYLVLHVMDETSSKANGETSRRGGHAPAKDPDAPPIFHPYNRVWVLPLKLASYSAQQVANVSSKIPRVYLNDDGRGAVEGGTGVGGGAGCSCHLVVFRNGQALWGYLVDDSLQASLTSGAFLMQLAAFIEGPIQGFDKTLTSLETRTQLAEDEPYRYLYFNHMNLALKDSLRTGAKGAQQPLNPQIQALLLEMHEAFSADSGHSCAPTRLRPAHLPPAHVVSPRKGSHDSTSGDATDADVQGEIQDGKGRGGQEAGEKADAAQMVPLEIAVKTSNDGWVVGRRSNGRELYVLGEKRSSNLAEVKDEVDRITANYFSNIFL